MKKLLLPLVAIIAASCSPFPQDGTAKTVYVSVSLTYEDSQKAIPLPYTDNDARAFRDEMKFLAEASGMAFEAHEFIEEGSHLAEKRTKAIYGRDSLLAYIRRLCPGPDDIIIFYFSGHGILSEGESQLAIGPDCGREDMLPVRDIREALASLPGRKCMVIDSCQSGSESAAAGTGETFGSGGEYLGRDILSAFCEAVAMSFTAAASDGVYVLSACTARQNSSAGASMPGYTGSEGYSVFTYCLLRSLGYDFAEQEARLPAVGMVTFYSLYQGVLESIPDEFAARLTAQATRQPLDLVLFSYC